MAFDIRFLGKVSSTANSKALTTWSYTSATDTLTTIKADGYFNNVMINLTTGEGKFSVGDTIIIVANDDHQIRSVSSITGLVTTISVYKREIFGNWIQREVNTEYTDERDGLIVVSINTEATGDGTQGEMFIETPTGTKRTHCQCVWRTEFDMYVFAASATSSYKREDTWIVTTGYEEQSPTYTVWYIPFSFGNDL